MKVVLDGNWKMFVDDKGKYKAQGPDPASAPVSCRSLIFSTGATAPGDHTQLPPEAPSVRVPLFAARVPGMSGDLANQLLWTCSRA